ncbi:hypothetical protein QJU89_00210 [Pasteurella skyensis]|uniref:Uncharacterized protein n=1 Tax=Phocoenobacter skyensis TaxID=97481 RepID=A0AAJ6NZY5_9PAST|nr:hypothetical protein [Pasteurella skyensis]MDP8161852.1 hypothetical protein [Pasteurella skyensis]MDP8172008.1 hypothetical protein [Pasteurella skyensis]MDP8176243.1 hypothetical protein [Pasteurella skyensis]MDP8178263.1 hypothetical protein [Pasteurella skyensis]MDP8182129.1 hypothetical protein [Pasteurella skyensis]
MDYDNNRLLIFSLKVSVGYIPFIGPILNQGINEIQNSLEIEKYSNQISELQNILCKDINNKIPIRSAEFEKYFSEQNKNVAFPTINDSDESCDSFISYLQTCMNELNVAESCIVLIYFLNKFAYEIRRLKTPMHESTKNCLLLYAEQTCMELEKTVLSCKSLNTLFYAELAMFLNAVCNDLKGFSLFSAKAVSESENDYIKLYWYVKLRLFRRGDNLQEYITNMNMSLPTVIRHLELYFQEMQDLIESVKNFYSFIDPDSPNQKKYTEQDEHSIAKYSELVSYGKDINGLLCSIYSHTINVLGGFKTLNGERVCTSLIMNIAEEFYDLYDKCGKDKNYAESAAEICDEIYKIS